MVKPKENNLFRGRIEWDNRAIGTQYSRAMWQILAISTTMLSILSTSAAFYFAKQSEYIPYIVEVDTHGRVRYQGVPEKGNLRDERITRSAVVEFVAAARTVTADVTLQKNFLDKVQAHLSADDPAARTIVKHYTKTKESDPYVRAKSELVSFRLQSALPTTDHTWEVDWIETVTDHSGTEKSSFHMRAKLTIYFADKAVLSLENLHYNPTNMYVHDLSWSQTL